MIAGNSFCPGNLTDGYQSQEQTQQQKEMGNTPAKEVIKALALCAQNCVAQNTQHGRNTSQCHPNAPQSSQQTCHQDSRLGWNLNDPVRLMSPFRLTKETTW